jgi:acylphosphatase
MEKQAEILVLGMVQGVFFRTATQQKARELDLTGWVRNEPDGSVKILAHGKENNLQKLIDWCGTGPPFARIDKVEVNWKEKQEGFKNFEIEK